MKIRNRVAIGAVTTGVLGAISVVGTILLSQSDLDNKNIDTGMGEKQASPIINKASQGRRGRIGRGGLKNTRVKDLYEKINMKEICTNKKGTWKDEDKKCILPEEIKAEEIVIDSINYDNPEHSRRNKDQCHENGGYYGTTSNRHDTQTCLKPGVILRKDYEKEIVEWEEFKDVKAPDEGQTSLTHFYNNGFLKIRKNDKNFAVVIPEEKLTGELESWDFTKHLKLKSYSAAISDICSWSKKSMGNDWSKYFLYNEKTGKGWDCGGNKEIFFLENL